MHERAHMRAGGGRRKAEGAGEGVGEVAVVEESKIEGEAGQAGFTVGETIGGGAEAELVAISGEAPAGVGTEDPGKVVGGGVNGPGEVGEGFATVETGGEGVAGVLGEVGVSAAGGGAFTPVR